MRKTLLSILFLLLLAVPAIAQKPAPAAAAPAPAQTTPAATAPVKPSEVEDLKIENLKLKLSLYTQHKVDLQREEDSVNQDGEKLAEQIIADHPWLPPGFQDLDDRFRCSGRGCQARRGLLRLPLRPRPILPRSRRSANRLAGIRPASATR